MNMKKTTAKGELIRLQNSLIKEQMGLNIQDRSCYGVITHTSLGYVSLDVYFVSVLLEKELLNIYKMILPIEVFNEYSKQCNTMDLEIFREMKQLAIFPNIAVFSPLVERGYYKCIASSQFCAKGAYFHVQFKNDDYSVGGYIYDKIKNFSNGYSPKAPYRYIVDENTKPIPIMLFLQNFKKVEKDSQEEKEIQEILSNYYAIHKVKTIESVVEEDIQKHVKLFEEELHKTEKSISIQLKKISKFYKYNKFLISVSVIYFSFFTFLLILKSYCR